MARITKKQLKEDKLLSTTAKFSVFLNEYWGHMVGVIVAIAVIAAVIVVYGNYVTNRNEKATISFNEAKDLYDKAEVAVGAEQKAVSMADYENARKKFLEVSESGGNRDTVSKALFYSAKSLYRLDRYQEAALAFQKFVDKYPNSILAIHVQKAIGNCYEQLGGDENLKKAIQQYDMVLKSPETHVTLEAVLDKGRCYEKLGDWDQAIATYKTITDRFKQNVELAIQNEAKALAQTAKDVISEYDTLLGADQTGDAFARFMDEADSFAAAGQWFEALKAYDKAIVSQKKLWYDRTSKDNSLASQNASKALKDYEDSSASVLTNVASGRKLEKQGDWDRASSTYNRAVDFDFLPGRDLFEKAQFRIYWINSVERPSSDAQ